MDMIREFFEQNWDTFLYILAAVVLIYIVWKLFKGFIKFVLALVVIAIVVFLIFPEAWDFVITHDLPTIVAEIANKIGEGVAFLQSKFSLEDAGTYVNDAIDGFKDAVTK